MTKGSGTRSGLLWEVERLLNEAEELPQVLLMENVPQVISQANIADFHKWQKFLEEKGYSNYTDTLNAKDYGVAQNRNRTFMVSILGEYYYKFPSPIPLTKTIADYLEPEVDERFYINNEKAQELINQLVESGQLEDRRSYVDGSINNPKPREISNCIMARDRGISNHQSVGGQWLKENNKEIIGGIYTDVSERFQRGVMKDMSRSLKANIHDSGVVEKIIFEERTDEGVRTFKDNICGTIRTIDSGGDKRAVEIRQIGNITPNPKRENPQTFRVYDKEGLSPTLSCMEGGNLQPMIVASRGRNPDDSSDRQKGSPMEQRLEPNSQGICNTLASVQEDNYVLEPTIKIKQATKEGYIECKVGGVADLSYPTSKTRRGRVQDNGDTSPTITATETSVHKIESPYRIRKLTPRECARLMKFSDKDADKMLEVNSNSQVYKQCGNSIVVSVLEAIFRNMNIQRIERWS